MGLHSLEGCVQVPTENPLTTTHANRLARAFLVITRQPL